MYKLEFDEQTAQPYIQIDQNLRLTPYDTSDVPDLVTMLNDPSIGQWSYRRPYPYTDELSRDYADFIKPEWDAALGEMETYRKDRSYQPRPVGNYPLCMLRYLPTDRSSSGTLDDLDLKPGQVIGDLYFYPFAAKGETVEEVVSRPAKDQAWEVSYDLLPKLQGRGIGTKLLTAGIEAFIQWIGIEKVIATVEERNTASRGLVQKCGFVEIERFITPWPVEKGGGERNTVRYAWTNPNV